MREEMYIAPSYLRAQIATGSKAPVLAMTASAKRKTEKGVKKNELEEIKIMCGIQFTNTVVITISPILHNHLYVNLKKPPSIYGFLGKEHFSGSSVKIGSVHFLWRIYLKRFVSDVKEGKTPKRAILYVKKYLDLADLDEFLTEELGHLEIAQSPNTCPWVVNSSATGKITAERIRERSQEENSSIYLYITTSVMLFGLNIKDVSIVMLLAPFFSLNSLIQAGGRAGRRQGNGKRRRSVIYTLYNGTDLKSNSPMENSVRDFCMTESCLKKKMSSYFSDSPLMTKSQSWCCSFCSF